MSDPHSMSTRYLKEWEAAKSIWEDQGLVDTFPDQETKYLIKRYIKIIARTVSEGNEYTHLKVSGNAPSFVEHVSDETLDHSN